ncbi:hypothetical protein EGW08_014369 [Elysia chlorotica]|uniref:E3 ubiquitin-protein ligase RNF10 n=1 Tax=Elysia chlorotica TaxID=188477 RepID=A0A3S1BY26_ELYCH|nr:hypothetical protein EGW08_014369 [Elysia chlorotica]
MCDELNFTMDKKVPARQSPCLSRNSGEKKSDYLSNKNGRPKKHRDSSNGGRCQDLQQQTPKPVQKYGRGYSDKRPRQRGYPDYRPSEEVAEPFELDIDLTSRKGKGNANHLLNFSYQERGYSTSSTSSRGAGSWGGRKGFRLPTATYKKEQYLQASCQFIVQDDGDYSRQAIDPDALVDWDKVQLVRTFSSELVCCPICLDVPIAAKITRCGHTYCWGCILHYLHVNSSPKIDTICPVCPERIDADKLRSVQTITVPDYKVGDDIEMKLMRKSKGSVFVYPEEDWSGIKEGHLNMNAGNKTKFSKLLLASWQQVKADVIDREKGALARGLIDAEEEEEVCFLQMAQHLLEKREEALQKSHRFNLAELQAMVSVDEVDKGECRPVFLPQLLHFGNGSDVSFDGSKISTIYTDAFDDEVDVTEATVCDGASSGCMSPSLSDEQAAADIDDVASALSEDEHGDSKELHKLEEDCQNHQSPHLVDLKDTLTPEEATEHLELPDTSGYRRQLPQEARSKDTYHFYQASSGQHIYMHSLNAQCLTREYGNLENSPRTVTATIVAIERIFMTEEMRKRLRYLNHIPLTTEFHVVEMKFKPPVVSKETLKHFQPEFEKRRKFRQRKAREEKARASMNEVEHRKAHGTYVAPEIHIPLDNTTDFPSYMAERQRKESTNSDFFPDSTSAGSDGQGSPGSPSPRSTEALATSPPLASFAQKLRGNSIAGTSPPTWPRISPSLVHSATMPEMGGHHTRGVWGALQPHGEDADGGEAYQAPSMASSWLSSLHDLAADQPSQVEATQVDAMGKKKKKKKEKQLLFSTSMARKN